jgi:hypothetical protein
LPDERKVLEIKPQGIILKSGEAIELIPWSPIDRVSLLKTSQKKDSKSSYPREEVDFETNNTQNMKQNEELESLKKILKDEGVLK